MWDGAEDYIFNKPPQPTLGFSTFSLPHPKPRELHRGDSGEGRGNSPWQFRLLPHCCKSGCPRMTDLPTPVREGDLLPEGVGPAGRAVSIHRTHGSPLPDASHHKNAMQTSCKVRLKVLQRCRTSGSHRKWPGALLQSPVSWPHSQAAEKQRANAGWNEPMGC